MTQLVLKEGTFLYHDEELGYIYKLNGSTYAYKSGNITKIGGTNA